MLPAQGAGSDRRSGADRQADVGSRDRGEGGTRDALRAGEPHQERPDAVRDPQLRRAGPARRPRIGILNAFEPRPLGSEPPSLGSEPRPKEAVNYLPNILSLARILAAPYLFVLLWRHEYWLGVIVMFLTGVSDGLDGYLARRLNAHSKLGAMLDPIGGQLLFSGIFLVLRL